MNLCSACAALQLHQLCSCCLVLAASLCCGHNGSHGRGKEHLVAGKIVSKPECWVRKDVSDISGLVAGLLCPSSEAQPTHRKCTRGYSVFEVLPLPALAMK